MALTWRNVDAPDFRGSMDGYRQFSNLIGEAFGGLDRAVGRYDNAQSERANNALLMDFAGISDPEAARARLAALGSDPNAARYNAATIGAVTGRPGQILNEQLVGTQAEGAKFRLGVDQRNDEVDQRTAGDVSNFLRTGELDESKLTGMGAKARMDLLLGRQNYVGTDLNQAATRQDMQFRGENQGWTREDRAFQQEAQIHEARMARIFDPNERMAYVNTIGNERMQGFLRGRVGSEGMSPATDILTGATLSANTPGGADPTRVMNYQARGKGFNAIPASVQTLGDFADFGKRVNAGGAPSSAGGLYQIVGKTMSGVAEQLYGKNWRSRPFTVQEQDNIARKIFEDNRGSADALRKQWVSLSPAQAERLRKMPWEAARDFIANKESGAASATALLADAANSTLAGRRDTALASARTDRGTKGTQIALDTDTMVRDFAAAAKPEGSQTVSEVAGDLKKIPAYKGMSDAAIEQQLELVISAAQKAGRPMNARMAGVVLKNSTNADRNWWFGTELFGGAPVSSKKVNELVGQYAKGQFDDRMRALTRIDASQGTLAEAETAVAKTTADLRAAEAAFRRGDVVDVQGYRNAALAAQQVAARQREILDEFGTAGVPDLVPEVRRSAPPVNRPTSQRRDKPLVDASVPKGRSAQARARFGDILSAVNPVSSRGLLVQGIDNLFSN